MLATRGLLVLYGSSSGSVPPIDVRSFAAKGSPFLTSIMAKDYMGHDEQTHRLQDLFAWTMQGIIRPLISQTYPLTGAAKAHEALESGQTVGKVLLRA